MLILSAFVAFQRSILVEDRLSNQMASVINGMLSKIPRHDTKVSYQYESHIYHFLVENEIVYGCISDITYENRVIYAFLSQVRDQFKTQLTGSVDHYPRVADLVSSKCRAFSSTLSRIAKQFNENPESDTISKIKEQLNTTRLVMLENLDNIVDRGQRIDNLCDRTEMLRDEAQGFNANSMSLRSTLRAHHVKIVIGAIVLLAVIGLVIAFSVCGVNFKQC